MIRLHGMAFSHPHLSDLNQICVLDMTDPLQGAKHGPNLSLS